MEFGGAGERSRDASWYQQSVLERVANVRLSNAIGRPEQLAVCRADKHCGKWGTGVERKNGAGGTRHGITLHRDLTAHFFASSSSEKTTAPAQNSVTQGNPSCFNGEPNQAAGRGCDPCTSPYVAAIDGAPPMLLSTNCCFCHSPEMRAVAAASL